jgi:hypothetical protein
MYTNHHQCEVWMNMSQNMTLTILNGARENMHEGVAAREENGCER